jgi:phosphoribosylformylglycinamidine cyclo-ligase
LPQTLLMNLAVGESKWFSNEARCMDLINGWREASMVSGCIWGGGETPCLSELVEPGAAVLGGSATGMVAPKSRLIISSKIREGDVIVLIHSSGIHANGLTLARKIASKLPKGYLTEIPGGKTYGDALLEPSVIYVPFMEECFDFGVDFHYAVNITGHGFRKLMRAPQPFTYVIDKLPEPDPLFGFLQEHASMDDADAYGTFNMGAGFAVIVPEENISHVVEVIRQKPTVVAPYGYTIAGRVEKGEKKVVLRPLGIEFAADTLNIR